MMSEIYNWKWKEGFLWVIVGVCLYHFQSRYPYYFIYDLDYIVALDLLLIDQGLVPRSLNHPASGSYLFLYPLFRVWLACSEHFPVGGDWLAGHINPALGIRLVLEFVRYCLLGVVFGFFFFLWRGASRIVTSPRWIKWLLLLYLLSFPSAFYQVTHVRSVSFGLFWWALSFDMATSAIVATSLRKKHVFYLLSGIFGGISVFSKVTLLSFQLITFFFFMYYWLNHRLDLPAINKNKKSSIPAFLMGINFLVFLILSGLSVRYIIPEHSQSYAISYSLGGKWSLGCVGLLSLFIISWLSKNKKIPTIINSMMLPVSLFLTGAFVGLFSLGSIFLYYPKQGILYVLYNFQSVLMRHSTLESHYLSGEYLQGKITNLFGFDTYICVIGLCFLVLALLVRKGEYLKRVASGLLYFLIFANIIIFVRPFLRDMLLRDMLIFTGILGSLWIINFSWSHWLKVFVASVLGGGIALNTCSMQLMSKRIDALYHSYGWHHYGLLDCLYHAHKPLFKGVSSRIKPVDGHVRLAMLDQARDWTYIKNAVDFVLPNSSVHATQVGQIWEDMILSLKYNEFFMDHTPEKIHGAVWVDLSSVKNSSRLLMIPRRVHLWEVDQKSIDYFLQDTKGNENYLSVLPRSDLNVYLFLENKPEDVDIPYVSDSGMRLDLRNGNSTLSLYGYQVEEYTWISKKYLEGLCGIVIAKSVERK